MSSADVDAKAGRYLTAGRVTVVEVTPGRVRARVHGTADDPYAVLWTPVTSWACDCPAGVHRTRCAHVAAVQRVTCPRPDHPDELDHAQEEPHVRAAA